MLTLSLSISLSLSLCLSVSPYPSLSVSLSLSLPLCLSLSQLLTLAAAITAFSKFHNLLSQRLVDEEKHAAAAAEMHERDQMREQFAEEFASAEPGMSIDKDGDGIPDFLQQPAQPAPPPPASSDAQGEEGEGPSSRSASLLSSPAPGSRKHRYVIVSLSSLFSLFALN